MVMNAFFMGNVGIVGRLRVANSIDQEMQNGDNEMGRD